MAAQKTLSWNGVTICDNTLAKSGYFVTEKHKKGNFFEFFFPNTTGRYKRLTGSQNTAASSRTIDISGTTYSASGSGIAPLRKIVTDIGTALASASPHGTLSYGILDDSTEQSETNMDCDFNVRRFWKSATGDWFMEWTARFTKWAA